MICCDCSAMTDWSPKQTMSCTPKHTHFIGYIVEVPPRSPQVDFSDFHYTCDLIMFDEFFFLGGGGGGGECY